MQVELLELLVTVQHHAKLPILNGNVAKQWKNNHRIDIKIGIHSFGTLDTLRNTLQQIRTTYR